MIIFHKEKIKEPTMPDPNGRAFFSDLENLNLTEFKTGKNLADLKKVFTRNEIESTKIENHCFDVISPILNDHQTFSIYLHLYRLSNNNLIITKLDELLEKLDLTKSELLSILATLEENFLIKISSTEDQKTLIELNRNWIDIS